jgi:hypothetical protein
MLTALATALNGPPIPSLDTQPQDAAQDATLMLPPHLDTNFPFFGDASFSDVFDSLNWVFDGIHDSFNSPAIT